MVDVDRADIDLLPIGRPRYGLHRATRIRDVLAQTRDLEQRNGLRTADVESAPKCGLRDSDREEGIRSEEHTSELQSQSNIVCRLLLEKKNREITALCP